MYLLLNNHLPEIEAGEITQVTLQPLLNNLPQKTLGGSERLALHKGDTLNTCFGSAVITSIILYRGNSTLSDLQNTTLEKWARNEGFSSYKEAKEYFSEKYGDGWDTRDMMSIKFKGEWVQEDE
jgi:hypothetical protein